MPLPVRGVGSLLGGWGDDPLWGALYDWSVEHPGPGRALWRAVLGSDLRLLHAAAGEVGRQEPGSAVLDVPCGGGVALRALRPGAGVRYVAADIARGMLDRTLRLARERDVVELVEPVQADVGALPFADGEFDLVVSFTGLHCFPDPEQAVREMVRVLHPGGVLTGSAVLRDAGLRHLPLQLGGRASGLMGPGATGEEVVRWLGEAGLTEVTLRRSGAVGYFRGRRGGE